MADQHQHDCSSWKRAENDAPNFGNEDPQQEMHMKMAFHWELMDHSNDC